MARKNRKSKTSVSVNFKGVEGKGQRVKPGEYEAQVSEDELPSLENAGKGHDDYIKWVFELDDGGKAYFNTSLSKQSLWNLRGLLEAMGEEVPDSEMDIDLTEMGGKRIGVVIEEEEYQGKMRPKMVDYYSLEDAGEADVKDKKKKGAKDEDTDTDKKTRDEIEEMDRDDLEEFVKENDMSVDPDDFKKDKKLLAAILEELDEGDYFEKPKKGGKKDKKAKKLDKLAKSDVEDMDQKELEDVNDKYELGLELDEIKSLRKMVKAVVDALEENDYLED